MRICIPVETDRGMDSVLYGHFGSAPLFLVVDTDTMTSEAIDNRDDEHVHGGCNPVNTLNGHNVDALVVSGIGPNAVRMLNMSGIRVYMAQDETVRKNAELMKESALAEISESGCCTEHGHGGGCGYHHHFHEC